MHPGERIGRSQLAPPQELRFGPHHRRRPDRTHPSHRTQSSRDARASIKTASSTQPCQCENSHVHIAFTWPGLTPKEYHDRKATRRTSLHLHRTSMHSFAIKKNMCGSFASSRSVTVGNHQRPITNLHSMPIGHHRRECSHGYTPKACSGVPQRAPHRVTTPLPAITARIKGHDQEKATRHAMPTDTPLWLGLRLGLWLADRLGDGDGVAEGEAAGGKQHGPNQTERS